MVYAGFWWRVLAYFLDYILISVLSFPVGIMVGIFLAIFNVNGTVQVNTQVLGDLILLVTAGAYFTWFESSTMQATLGKKVCGLKVTDLEGNRITPQTAFLRYLGKLLSGLIMCIGFLMVAFTEKKQGLHDLMVDTLVVKN